MTKSQKMKIFVSAVWTLVALVFSGSVAQEYGRLNIWSFLGICMFLTTPIWLYWGMVWVFGFGFLSSNIKNAYYFIRFWKDRCVNAMFKSRRARQKTETSEEAASKKRKQKRHWFAWWKIDLSELSRQINEYDTLQITQSARGAAFFACLFIAAVSTLFAIWLKGDFRYSVIDAELYIFIGLFVLYGHRWATVCLILLWTIEKMYMTLQGFQLYPGHSANPVIHIFWWCIFMQLFYFAFRVEQGRLQKLAESNKSVTYKPTWRGISTVAGFIVVIIGTYITIYLWESSDVNKFAEHSKIYVAKRSDLVHEILKSNEKALTDAIKVDLYNNPLYAATVRSEIDASQKLLDKNHILIDNTFTDFERDEKNQNFSSSAQDEFMKGYAEARDQTKEKFANFFQTESNILKFGSILLDFIAAHSSDVTTKDGQFTFATYEEVSQFGQYSAEMKELAEKEQSAIKELQ